MHSGGVHPGAARETAAKATIATRVDLKNCMTKDWDWVSDEGGRVGWLVELWGPAVLFLVFYTFPGSWEARKEKQKF